MPFDLYGTTAPAPAPALTTAEALKAPEWTLRPDGKWQLVLSDHTEYNDEHGGGEWTCHLYVDDGDWIYDFDHDFRGGPQDKNGTDLDAAAPVEVAQAEVKRSLRLWTGRWTDSAQEDLRAAAKPAKEDL